MVRLLPDTAEQILSGGILPIDHAGGDGRGRRQLPVVFGFIIANRRRKVNRL